MSKRSKTAKDPTGSNECCVCIRKATKKAQNITSKYVKTQKESIHDILKKLELINYEVNNSQK